MVSRWVGKDLSAGGGAQPGDLAGCIHALASPAGCGHTPHCASCPIRNTFESVLRSGQAIHDVETEATLSIEGNEARLWLEASADPLIIDGKRHVILALNNITARKRAEEELRRSKEQLDLAIAAADLGMWDRDLVTGKLIWSERSKAMFGLAPDAKMSYDLFLDAVHPDDRALTHAALMRSLQEKVPYDIEYRTLWPNGTMRWIAARGRVFFDEKKGKPLRMIGTVLDITERKRGEGALKDANEKLRQVLEGIADAYIALDMQWRFLDINLAAEKIFLRSKEELLGKVLWEEYPRAVNTEFYRQYHMAREQGRPVHFEERSVITDKWFEAWAYPRKGYLEVYLRDITERKSLEDSLRQSRDEMEIRVKERTHDLNKRVKELACL